MKNYTSYIFSSLFCTSALFLASCTPTNAGPNGVNKPPTLSGEADGGLNMSVSMTGLETEQTFCFSWTLFQDDGQGGWYIIDQREEPICGDPGDLSISDFATCYDGKHFLVQYDVSILDETGAEIASASATSGGAASDVCVKNVDTNSTANIQFNNEGSAGGVNPGIDIDQVCSNDKVQLEGDELVSALWLQPDNCELPGTPDSYCILGSGSGIETQRTGLTLDGSTRYIFSTSAVNATWDLIYLSLEATADGSLTLFNAPFALHHFANNGSFGREELTGVIGAYQMGSSVGVIREIDGKVVVTYDLDTTCDGDVDLGSEDQEIPAPTCSGGCEPIGVVATGGSAFDIVYNCAGDIETISCDALSTDGICD
jgi:hypothetical protein